ncbi:uncharacterized protein LOC126749387 [Anthonomus grandis grandis]|uniref:uncharacterized protein LOC126749387 n=1 Tax=Anthonomus grandis grandis TaxID=2921223 RepID=UPI0021650321|nr:uncharacterized protein LOC126749387 [Anthonomus grandis grandis]
MADALKLSSSNKKKPSEFTFQELDQQLLDLNDLMEKSNLSTADRTDLFKPILERIPKNKTAAPLFTYMFICFSLLLFGYIKWESLYWHITALTRIALVKILPYWDWRYLKNDVCLISKFDPLLPQGVEEFDCNLCENLKDFQDLSLIKGEVDISDLIRQCVQLEIPVVINNQIDHWLKESPQELFDQLLEKPQFAHSIPCNLHTNIHNSKLGEPTILDLYEKTELFHQFFIHFQNCDSAAMKVFRNFTAKPSVVPEELSPVSYNWLIWNNRYDGARYKKLNLIERHIVIGQIMGKSRLRLTPRNNCQDQCPALEGDLKNGDLMVVTSLWDVEYLPSNKDEKGGHNMAAVLELKTGLL